jgi:hypothetical protein
MMIVLGRPLRENEYPDGLPTLRTEVIEIALIRGGGPFASGLHAFLQRTLPLPGRQPHVGAEDAAAEVLAVAREIGVARCRSALGAFVEDMNRVLADARDEAEDGSADPEDEAITAAVDAFTAELVAESEIAFEDLPVEPAYAADPDVVEKTTELRSESAFEDLPVKPAYAADPDVVEKELRLAAVDRSARAGDGDPVTSEWPTSEWPQSRVAVDDEDPAEEPRTFNDESERFVASTDDAPEPVSVVEPEAIPDWRIAPQPEYVEAPVTLVQAEPAPGIAREPRLADMMEPAPAAREPVPASPPKPQAPPSKRKRRGSKGQRDKLRSNAVPAPNPPPVVQAPAPAATIPVASVQPLSRAPEPVRQSPTPISVKPTPISVKPTPPPKPAPLRIKTEAPSGYDGGRTRPERRESYDVDAMPYVEREAAEASSEFPWRMAGAAFAVMIVLVVVGRAYMPDRGDETATNGSTTEAPVVPKRVDVATTPGSITVTTQPAGAHVLLDGKAVGETPVTLDGVVPGKHTITLVTSKGTVKRTVRVEPGKPVKLDIPIYSGMIAVFSPIPLDIAENGRAIGTSEQGRLILSPGRHLLTLTNREHGYTGTQVVDIDPGEESSISVQPTGDLNANAVPWAEVWMDGKKVGDTPLAGVKVPLGTHEVVFKNPQFPDRRVTVKVSATAPAAASVDFSKQ